MLKRKDRRDNRATVKMQHELLGRSTVDQIRKEQVDERIEVERRLPRMDR
jgi:hypothetical protein